ncbi:MAG TPA: alkaline phosphatase family protein [Myxococcales bacterium]|nr:alkaline phosphatase family protein [Myxococcales bacterium]
MIAALLLAAAAAAPQGRLVVLVVVDQLRYQDLLWLAPELGPKGFAGLGQPAPMRYETALTETAVAHAVLSTGAYADLNGIPGNSFWKEGKFVEAVDDPSCPVWGSKSGRSAAALLAPTIGDALKLNTDGASRVVAVSVKDRSALLLGGTSADLAIWWEAETGEMASTTCYAPGPPGWVPRHPAEAFKDWVWTPSRPEALARLLPEPRALGSTPFQDIRAEFPHRVGQGKVDARLYKAIRNEPPGTTIALRTAREAVAALGLGDRGKTDLLTVALAAVDGVGHQFGTLSRERTDAVLRTHDELSTFLGELRRRLGKRLSVVLTADHGLMPGEPDERRLRVGQGGTIATDQLLPRLNHALEEALGARPEGWVANIESNVVSLRAPFSPKAIEVAVELLRREPGIWRAVPAAEIDQAEPFIRHAFFPGRSGQVLLVVRPLWTLKPSTYAADHGSVWNDDSLVPLLVQSADFRLRREPLFRATQVAPTVAALLGTAPPSAALDASAVERP